MELHLMGSVGGILSHSISIFSKILNKKSIKIAHRFGAPPAVLQNGGNAFDEVSE